MYDLGIIGGMGSLASAEIYKSIINRTEAKNDCEHISIVILNKPSIPDRSKAILDNGISPVASLNECIGELEKLRVKNFIIACNTAHYFVDQLVMNSKIKFINMIDEVLINMNESYKDNQIIVLSTIGTIKSDIYKTNQYSKGLNIIYPAFEIQEIIMNYIYEVKSGIDKFQNIKEIETSLNKLNTDYPNSIFLIACTELSLISKYLSKQFRVIDAVDILVDSTIIKCGYKLRGE